VQGDGGRIRRHLVWDGGLYTVQRAVRTWTHLYIRTYDSWKYANWADEELYDMTQDRYETNSIASECPDVVEHCRAFMDGWVAEQKAKPNWNADPLELILEERGISRGQ
jgi:hypothetical protein